MASAAAYIEDLQSRGLRTFSTEEAAVALGGSIVAVRAALRRLRVKGAIASPHRGYYVIVPPEYRRLGCLPPELFVPDLMQRLGVTYYVALLSAAQRFGAAHQQPQEFQVMVPTSRRPLLCGDVRVAFITRSDAVDTPTIEQPTLSGPIRVATAEATALELVGYSDRAAGLHNVATILIELAESLDATLLERECARSPVAWVQRLGYLLELVEQSDFLPMIEREVLNRARLVAPLVPAHPLEPGRTSTRWKLNINAEVEPDL